MASFLLIKAGLPLFGVLFGMAFLSMPVGHHGGVELHDEPHVHRARPHDEDKQAEPVDDE